MNILLQAAVDNSTVFIDAVEPYLGRFSWPIVIKALDICLKKRHYYIADILLRTNTYTLPNLAFSLCKREAFLDSISKYSNGEVFNRLNFTFYYDNTTLLLSDKCLEKICIGACYAGNVELIDYLLIKEYFTLNTRLHGKSILRMALEGGQANLAKYLIKKNGADIIFNSDTPFYNPHGDSLIYVAVNEQIDIFKYLLKLGSNPNAYVRHDDTSVIALVYWCIQTGQDLIVKALLDAGCDVDFDFAHTLNNNPDAMESIDFILRAAEIRRNRLINILTI